MDKKCSIILIIAFSTSFFPHSLKAQVKNSVYSMFGVGQIVNNGFGINKSLAGTGIAFQSGRSINYLNPASYLGLLPDSYLMEIGVYGIYNKSEDKNTSQTSGNVNVTHFAASLYVKNWWALSFGVLPFSSVNYQINSSDEIQGQLTSLEKSFEGTGGLNRVYVGNSIRLYKGLSIGFNASYLFGRITQTETAAGNDSFLGFELKNESSTKGLYLDYGLQYSIGNDASWLYTIGLIYGARKKLSTAGDLRFTYNEIASTLEQEDPSDLKIPQRFGLGISLKRSSVFRAGFDYASEDWSHLDFSNSNLVVRNSNRVSIGIEYAPAHKGSLVKRLLYRVGASYNNSYLEVDDIHISSRGLNFGVGIPYNRANIVNLAIEYGKEGSLEKGLIRDSYCVFYLNFSLYEIWSKHRFR